MKLGTRLHVASLKSLKLRSSIGEKPPGGGEPTNLLINGTFDDATGWTTEGESAEFVNGVIQFSIQDTFASIWQQLNNEELPVGTKIRISGEITNKEGGEISGGIQISDPFSAGGGAGLDLSGYGVGEFSEEVTVEGGGLEGTNPLEANARCTIGFSEYEGLPSVISLDNITVEIVG